MKRVRIGFLFLVIMIMSGCASNMKDGIVYLEEGSYEAAVSCFEKEIEEEKNLGEAYHGKAIALYELEDYQGAIDCFENALANKVEPTATIYRLMATSYHKLEGYESALDDYAKALAMDDCTEEMKQEMLFNEIAIYQKLGKWDVVKEKVSAYVEMYPDDNRMDKTIEFLETR